MKGLRKSYIYMLILILISTFILCSSSIVMSQSIIKLGHHHPVASNVDKFAHKFSELVAEKSNGEIEVQIFPGAQLGKQREAAEGVAMGSLQMTIVPPSYLGDSNPIMGIESLPFLFDSWEHADKALNGMAGDKIAELLLESSEVRILGFLHLGFRHMITINKTMDSVDDFKNVKIRSPEDWVWIRMFQLLGAKPTPVTWAEAYTALQSGLVEGMECPAINVIDMHFYEQTKILTKTKHMFQTMALIVNDSFYKNFPEEHQTIITKAAREAVNWGNTNITKAASDKALDELKEKYGMAIKEVKSRVEFQKILLPQWEEFSQKAPGADQIFKMIDDLR